MASRGKRDLPAMTYEEFRTEGPPLPDEALDEQKETAAALHAVRDNLDVELGLGWRKWGMPAVRDTVVLHIYSAMTKAGIGRELSAAIISGQMSRVDWGTVDRIMAENWRQYEEFCRRTGEDAQIPAALESAEYRFAKGPIPGVSRPGDLYALVCGTPAPS